MSVGIIILCIVILFIFFGLAERFFRKLGIPNWLAFLLVLSLVVGAIIPNLEITSWWTLNVSGFLIPIIIMVIFQILMGIGGEFLRSVFAIISVAALTVTARLIVPEDSAIMLLTSALIVGFLAGAAAYLVGQTRMAIIVGTMGGVVLGDAALAIIKMYFYDATKISLGMGNVFNSIVISVLFGLILYESINAMIRATNRKRIQISTLTFEAGEDVVKEPSGKRGRFFKGESEESALKEEFGNYEDYFDDRLL